MDLKDRLDSLRADAAYLNDAMRAIVDNADEALDDDQKQAFAEGEWLRNAMIAEGIELEDRQRALLPVIAAAGIPGNTEPGDGAIGGAPAFTRTVEDPYSDEYVRTVGIDEAFKRIVGDHDVLRSDGQEEITRKAGQESTDPQNMRGFKEYVRLHSSDAYIRAFGKMASGEQHRLTGEEQHAYDQARAFESERGMSTTSGNGGAMIPVPIDPSVIVTNVGTISPIQQLARKVSGTVNTWTGVTSAGVTFHWGTEGGDSTDIAAAFQAPTITAYRYDGVIPVTYEAFADIPNLASVVSDQLADGRNRHLATAFATGNGSTQPYGLVTALAAETSRWYQHATNSAFTDTDLIGTQEKLGPRFQQNAAWLGSLTYQNRIRKFGTTSYFDRTATLDQGVSQNILGKASYEVSDMTTGLNTVTDYSLVYGDINAAYTIYERVGMEVEFIPIMFTTGGATGPALPNGYRGWFCVGRIGADVVNNTAAVISVNPGA